MSIFLLSIILVGCLNDGDSTNKETKSSDPVNEETKASDPLNEETKASDPTNEEMYEFDATVIEANVGLLVIPVAGSSELSSSDKISVSIKVSEEQKDQSAESMEFYPGDLVRITYDGMIAESYPAQINKASKVEKIGRNLLIDAYKVMIDDIYQEDSALNDQISIIAFDTLDWTNLSNAEIEILISILEEEYKMDIVEATRDELYEMGLIDKEGLYFKDGIMIELTDIQYNDKSNELTATISKWRSGDGAIGWDVKAIYIDNKWSIERDNFWIS